MIHLEQHETLIPNGSHPHRPRIHSIRATILRRLGWNLANSQFDIKPLSHIYKNQRKTSNTTQDILL